MYGVCDIGYKTNHDKNDKAIPLHAWAGSWGSKRLRLSEFLENRHMNMEWLSATHTGLLYAPGDTPS